MKKGRFVSMSLTVLLATQGVLPVAATDGRLPDGAKVSVRLMQQLSSATAKDGDPISFTVVDDVIIDGQVAIRQGTPVRGVVVEAVAKRRMGRAGRLSYSLTETKGVDNKSIRLRTIQENKGGSNVTATALATAGAAVLFWPAAPALLLRSGKEVVIREGTRVDAFVDGDHVVRTDAAEPPPLASKTASGAGALTNEEVLFLHRAGLSPEVIVARIAAGSSVFSLDASDLVALKKAGVPNSVIEAMVNAKK